MQIAYQECYEKFYQSYGPFENWPLPYAYFTWYSTLTQQYQTYYLAPPQYSYLYEWARQLQKTEANKNKKPSRAQKRKMKKKQLEDQYNKQKVSIGKWVDRQRKDLVIGLQKIQQQQKKAKQKKQKKLSHLIEIHKEVFKHHVKRKTVVQNPNKRVDTANRKKRVSVIKKMKQIFQNRKQKHEKKQISRENQQVKNSKPTNEIKQQDQFEDVSSDEEKDFISKTQKLPTVSFPIKQIQYKNIGKLSGKVFNDIPMRQWVTNVPTPELQDIALRIINRLAYKQAIKKVNNPQKAKKIIVSGLKECKRTLTTILQNKKSKCLIVALNIERNNLIKGVDDEIQKCITLGQQNKIPVIHTSTRSKLGRAFTGKFGPRISIVSIINYEGYQDYMEQLYLVWKKSCEEYQKLP